MPQHIPHGPYCYPQQQRTRQPQGHAPHWQQRDSTCEFPALHFAHGYEPGQSDLPRHNHQSTRQAYQGQRSSLHRHRSTLEQFNNTPREGRRKSERNDEAEVISRDLISHDGIRLTVILRRQPLTDCAVLPDTIRDRTDLFSFTKAQKMP